MGGQRPSIGRIVHYRSFGSAGGEYPSTCRAAIVTDVGTLARLIPPGRDVHTDAEVVDLAVLNPEGMFFNQGVVQDEHERRGGSWHWPERVEDHGTGAT